MLRASHRPKIHLAVAAVAGLCWILSGCGGDTSIAPRDGANPLPIPGQAMGADPIPSGNLVTVSDGAGSLTFWPYTGASFDGTPSDPMNLIFRGKASPVLIRAALLALDGDRTAYGFPPVPPFDGTWTEAIGAVQTTYVDGYGWSGSVIQLQLGDYQPIRVHLRLFSASADGAWTLGAAHFEVLIPGTDQHEVLSWMIARAVVTADLVRSGLLGAPGPVPTDPLSAFPTYREIRPEVYNGLPEELKALVGGPADSVSIPVPLDSDGRAMLLPVAQEAAWSPGTITQTLDLQFQQVIPKPFCSDGPADYVQVAGPIRLWREASVDLDGTYSVQSNYQGRLHVLPLNVLVSPPVPAGEPYNAQVAGNQSGQLRNGAFHIHSSDRRVAHGTGGAELQRVQLRVGSQGRNTYTEEGRCLDGS